jgi:DNA-binding GntR family transcriptional regulator
MAYDLGVSEPRLLLRDEVYEALRERIVRGELRSGQRLRVRALAAELGVSRTPVREALRRLEDEGLIEASASRWTRVAPVDLEQAGRVYAVLTALERLAVFSGPFEASEIALLRRANERLASAISAEDAHEAYLADRAFHDAIIRHAGNDELERIVVELRVKTRLVEHELFGGSSAAAASVNEHATILAALEVGDAERAASAIEANHQQGLARLAVSAASINGGVAPAGS